MIVADVAMSLKLYGVFTIRQDKNTKIRRNTVARWFLFIGSDRASKRHENGRGGEF